MPNCANCDSFVTNSYLKVFAPPGMTKPRVCPYCEDKIRGNEGEVREKRN